MKESYHIVTISILYELLGVLGNLTDQPLSLIHGGTIDTLLHDTTPMLMSRYLSTLGDHGLKNKLIEWSLERQQCLLYDMIAVDILYKLLNDRLEECYHLVDMVFTLHLLYDLLKRSGAM